MIEELISETISRIEATEVRQRSRSTVAKIHFDHAVRHILIALWKSVKTLPASEVGINKRSGYYSENKRYRDKLLTYPQIKAAYHGLLRIGFIGVTENGYYDPDTNEGEITRIVAKDELLERLTELEGHPAISVAPDVSKETILLHTHHICYTHKVSFPLIFLQTVSNFHLFEDTYKSQTFRKVG